MGVHTGDRVDVCRAVRRAVRRDDRTAIDRVGGYTANGSGIPRFDHTNLGGEGGERIAKPFRAIMNTVRRCLSKVFAAKPAYRQGRKTRFCR